MYPRVLEDFCGGSTNGRTTEELRSYLAAIVDSSDDAIIGARLDGVIETWNKGAERLHRYATSEAIGRHTGLLEPAEQPGEIAAILEGVARGETIRHHRTVRLRKDGCRVSVSVTISPIRDAEGCVMGASAIARDIGEKSRFGECLAVERGALPRPDRLDQERAGRIDRGLALVARLHRPACRRNQAGSAP